MDDYLQMTFGRNNRFFFGKNCNKKYKSHPSILMIKERHQQHSFSFSHVLPEDVKREIDNLKTYKKSRGREWLSS